MECACENAYLHHKLAARRNFLAGWATNNFVRLLMLLCRS